MKFGMIIATNNGYFYPALWHWSSFIIERKNVFLVSRFVSLFKWETTHLDGDLTWNMICLRGGAHSLFPLMCASDCKQTNKQTNKQCDVYISKTQQVTNNGLTVVTER